MAGPEADAPAVEKLRIVLNMEEEILRRMFSATGGEVKSLINTINDFLKVAVRGREDDAYNLRTSLHRLRDVAYDIEDILDEVMILSGSHGRDGAAACFGIRKLAKRLIARRRISKQVGGIRARLSAIRERGETVANFTDRETPANLTRYRLDQLQPASLPLEGNELVGVDGYRAEMVRLLLKGGGEREVISVVGMGGLGKTSLLRSVFNDEKVKGSFACHAWIIVTPEFSIKDLLRSTLAQLFEEQQEETPESVRVMDEIQLADLLNRCLKHRRYVIVFDDVWSSGFWDYFKYALPEDHCGSRIIVATRSHQVGDAFRASVEIHLRLLSFGDAWLLFCNKAFGSATSPPELMSLAENFVRKCAGLPLEIVAIGGLLSKTEPNAEAWLRVLESLNWEITNRPMLHHVMAILLICYKNLPYHLRSCFLYFNMFPKNYSIKRMTLIRLWIAEGFVGSEEGKSFEETAEGYLKELIDRSMVEVAENYNDGRIRSCRIHNLFRETIILKSEEENFGSSLTKEIKKLEGTARRLSIVETNDDLLQNISFSYLRALLIFGLNAISAPSMLKIFCGFTLLRILDLEGAPVEMLPVELGSLVHLRYLSLRNTRIRELPKSLRKLINLQTLDLKGTYVWQLPPQIAKLKTLRHLLAYHYYKGREPPYYYALGVKVPRGIGRLQELQKLMYIDAHEDSEVLEELARLKQLKRLGIVKLREEDGSHLCYAVERMTELISFSAASVDTEVFLDLDYINSPPQMLERVYLRGPLRALPGWVLYCEKLVKLRLRWSKLSGDSLEKLGDLRSLIELSLIQAYDGEKLCFNEGFNQLRILNLDSLDKLEYVTVEGAMPSLQTMCIRSCKRLSGLPEGIEHLNNLKELHLFDMPALADCLTEGKEDSQRVKHIPVIPRYNNQGRVYVDL